MRAISELLLVDSLNTWVYTTASTDYYTWKADNKSTPTNGGYPVFGTAWTVPHSHCVCGGDTNIGHHTSHSVVQYEPLPDDWDGIVSLEGNYYLTHDMTMPARIYIAEGKTMNLCLNGYKLDARGLNVEEKTDPVFYLSGALNLCDCDGSQNSGGKITGLNNNYSPIIIDLRGTFSMYGGSITKNTTTGNTIDNSGIFTMYGGSITDNFAKETAGVYNEAGTSTMYGGSISHNGGGTYGL